METYTEQKIFASAQRTRILLQQVEWIMLFLLS